MVDRGSLRRDPDAGPDRHGPRARLRAPADRARPRRGGVPGAPPSTTRREGGLSPDAGSAPAAANLAASGRRRRAHVRDAPDHADRQPAPARARHGRRPLRDPWDQEALRSSSRPIDDGRFRTRTRWPFPRAMHARSSTSCDEPERSAIAYDVQFTEASGDTRRHPTGQRAHPRRRARRQPDRARRRRWSTGAVRQRSRRGGDVVRVRVRGARRQRVPPPRSRTACYRRVPLRGQPARQLPGCGGGLRSPPRPAPGWPDGSRWIDYDGAPDAISASRSPTSCTAPRRSGAVARKFVVVGGTAPTLQDLHLTSVSGGNPMSGAEIHATRSRRWCGGPRSRFPTWLDPCLCSSSACCPAARPAVRAAEGPLLVIAVGRLRRAGPARVQRRARSCPWSIR